MPKLQGIRERHHQPYWDTLIRAEANVAPSPTPVSSTRLFSAGVNLGQTQWTNMTTAGQFPSDNTYIVLAIRCWMQFLGTSAATMYALAATQLFLNFVVGDKPQFQAPAWFFPAGGGIWGLDSSTPIMNNGTPDQAAILKLAKPIPVPARQHFFVEANLYDLGGNSLLSDYLDESSSIGSREIKVFLDGIHTRDVL